MLNFFSYCSAAASGIHRSQNGESTPPSSYSRHKDVKSEVDERSSPSQTISPSKSEALTFPFNDVHISDFIHRVSDCVHWPSLSRRKLFSLAGSFSTSLASEAMDSRRFSL